MNSDGRLYTFLNPRGYCIHLINGKSLINALSILHDLHEGGRTYFSETVLSAQLLICLLKPTESFGLYIDSEKPYLRFKMESNFHGQMRSLLFPEDLREFPERLSGNCRLMKHWPDKQPYTSIIEMKDLSTRDLINRILHDSYQTEAQIYIEQGIDQAMLIIRMPPIRKDEVIPTFPEFMNEHKDVLSTILKKDIQDHDQLVEEFQKIEMKYLISKTVEFHCGCSHERMVENVRKVALKDEQGVFGDEESIEVNCDYCKSKYQISRQECLG